MKYLHTFDNYDEYLEYFNGDESQWDETDEGDFRYHYEKENN